jgi:rfaE bifunctional protein kinase chain/domain/rfaE bifunctional protein nucleotidyltransferase chain/domain
MADPSASIGKKILDLDHLAILLADLRAQGRTIVQCHGVFDLMHIGHIKHFQAARDLGDVLIVTLTPDHFVNKGPHRPAFGQDLRAEAIASLECVDYVAINRWPTAIETIKLLKPHIYVKGAEFREGKDVTGAVQLEADAIAAVGGKIEFTDEIVFSSSNLINRHLQTVPAAAREFLADFTAQHKPTDLLRYLDGAKDLKVLVVGETIIDEYYYCQTLGKSGKEPILAVRQLSGEKFAGGILAVANHAAAFCDRVDMLTFLGRDDPQEDFARAKLSPKVHPSFFYVEGAPTIVKRRFIENYPFQKLFEVYLINEDNTDAVEAARFHATLREVLPRFDLVIVTDFGHGMIDDTAVQLLCDHARCLAVNTQANAANHGFNTVSKYRRADFISVSENEIRLEARQRRQDLPHIVEAVARRLGCRKALVTRGQQGALCYDPAHGFVQVPALASHFTDRVGAGDAVFAVASLCMAQNCPGDALALIANAVGALAVAVVGNRSAVDRTALVRTIISLFK